MARVGIWNSGDRWDDPDLVWGPLSTETIKLMSADNLISAEIPANVKTQVLAKLGEIHTLLAPYLVNLSPDEKKQLATIGTSRAGMDAAFRAEMAAHPELVPSYVQMAEVNKDYNFRKDMTDMVAPAAELCEGLSDSETLANHDNYLAYLAFYANVQAAAKRNVPGIDTTYNRLKVFFPRGSRAPKPTPPPTP